MAQPRFALGRILHHAVGYALLGGIAGCGGQGAFERGSDADSVDLTADQDGPGTGGTAGEAPTPATRPGFEILTCPGNSTFQNLTLTEAYDFIALREVLNDAETGSETQARGTRCANASDDAACRAAFDAAWPSAKGAWTECGQIGCIKYAVVVNRGDEVKLIDTHDGVLALLGTIDNEHEAAFWADTSTYSPVCGETQFSPLEGGGFRLQTNEMVAECPIQIDTITFDVSPAGEFNVVGREQNIKSDLNGACVGRRSPTLVACERGRCSDAAGRFFADVAALEASAVEAFRLIADELTAFGAPDELVRAAIDAADDEVRHATITGVLARRHGSEPARATFADKPLRSLFAFALDNAIEGCVRETYGAACARYQALRAANPSVRTLLARIADDEQRHAELSWQIQAWLAPRLSEDERQQLANARKHALAELRHEVASDPDPTVVHHAGMPSAARATALLDSLEASLWATPAAA